MEEQAEKAEAASQRLEQIDVILRKLLEQNALGVISDERFATMMKGYEAEQEELRKTIDTYENLQESRSVVVENIQRHIQLVEQYTDLKKLDARILNRLIEKNLVHQRGEDEDGCPIQMIEICYRFIGRTDIDLYDLLGPAA